MGIKNVLTDHRSIGFTFPASTAVETGDLLWNNAAVAAKASAQADQLTEPANQALFAKNFLGVSGDKRLATETTTGERLVITDGIFDVTCPSTTWAVGELVGPSEAASGTALENQQVEKVTDPALAIGVCIKAGTSLTTVRCRLVSKVLPPSGLDKNWLYATYKFTGTPAATDQAFFVAPHACRVVAITEVHSVAAGGASVIQVTKDTGTNAPGAGTDLLTNNTNGGFDLNATANTPQTGALTATAGALDLAAGDRLSVDFAQAIQSSAGVLITVALMPL